MDSALLDTGAGYLTIPYRVHKAQHLRIYQELGRAPYRITSSSETPVLQRFVEIGLRFLVPNPDTGYGFWPEQFVRARAYLLDPDQAPKVKVLVGLDMILEHCVMHLDQDIAYLNARSSADPHGFVRSHPYNEERQQPRSHP